MTPQELQEAGRTGGLEVFAATSVGEERIAVRFDVFAVR